MITPSSFTLEEPSDGWGFDGGDELADGLLIISAPGGEVIEDEPVQVTGTVRTFVYADFADDFGLGDEALYTDFEREEVVVADSVNSTVPDEE